jgi:hypothetical protein
LSTNAPVPGSASFVQVPPTSPAPDSASADPSTPAIDVPAPRAIDVHVLFADKANGPLQWDYSIKGGKIFVLLIVLVHNYYFYLVPNWKVDCPICVIHNVSAVFFWTYTSGDWSRKNWRHEQILCPWAGGGSPPPAIALDLKLSLLLTFWRAGNSVDWVD